MNDLRFGGHQCISSVFMTTSGHLDFYMQFQHSISPIASTYCDSSGTFYNIRSNHIVFYANFGSMEYHGRTSCGEFPDMIENEAMTLIEAQSWCGKLYTLCHPVRALALPTVQMNDRFNNPYILAPNLPRMAQVASGATNLPRMEVICASSPMQGVQQGGLCGGGVQLTKLLHFLVLGACHAGSH